MLRTTLATTVEELSSLRPAWDALYRAGDHTFFQSFAWNSLAARVLHRGQICVCYVESDGGAALIPAAIDAGRIGLIGGAMFDYRDVLSTGDDLLLRHAWGRLSQFDLSVTLQSIRGKHRMHRWEKLGFAPKPFVLAPRVRKDECSAEEFATRHARSRRLLSRLRREGVELRQYSGADSMRVRHIYERKGQQRMPIGENLFTNPRRVEFMVEVASQSPAACEVFTLECGATLVAALVCFRDGGVRRFYTIEYDPNWARHSPGMALVFEITRISLAEGLNCDYMTGEQPHKQRYATSSESLFRIEASHEELRRVAGLSMAA